MERIAKSELIANRLKRAGLALKTLNLEIEELKQRLSLVEIHNDELQDLIDRIGESTALLASTITESMEGLSESVDFIQNEDENEEIAKAEEFGAGSETDFDF